jgi:hypothetical protein
MFETFYVLSPGGYGVAPFISAQGRAYDPEEGISRRGRLVNVSPMPDDQLLTRAELTETTRRDPCPASLGVRRSRGGDRVRNPLRWRPATARRSTITPRLVRQLGGPRSSSRRDIPGIRSASSSPVRSRSRSRRDRHRTNRHGDAGPPRRR